MQLPINDLIKDTLIVVLNFKEVWIFVGVIFVIFLIFEILLDLIKRKSRIRWFLNKKNLEDVLNLNPAEFEKYVAQLYKLLGYNSRVVGKTGDHGIDVIIKKDGIEEYIQCKRYKNNTKVGEGDIRNFYGSIIAKSKEGKGYFVTANVFTYPARKFAKGKPIELIDKYELVKYMKKARKT